MQDVLLILRRLTLRKAWNMVLVYTSYHLSRMSGRVIHWGKPISISIEPTTACNLRCPECPSGLRSFTRETGNLKTDFFRKTINQLHKDLLYINFYFQGEPYINPEFLDMVAYAKEKGIITSTSTNAHFLNDNTARRTVESGLDRIIISIDGTTQEVYEQYRKEGKLANVIQGTRNLVKWKKQLKSPYPRTIFQFLVVRPNEHQIPEVYKLANETGVDEVRLKTAQLYDFKFGNELMPVTEKYSRYRKKRDGTYEIKNKLLNQCWRMWHSCVITWDGLVVPCCFDKDAQHQLGNLKDKPMAEIWKNPAYQGFRKQILGGRAQIDICNNCTEGCKVWESV